MSLTPQQREAISPFRRAYDDAAREARLAYQSATAYSLWSGGALDWRVYQQRISDARLQFTIVMRWAQVRLLEKTISVLCGRPAYVRP